jgi:hypothetical protein
MRQSATLCHFQDRAPSMENLEVIDLWNLFHRHLRLLPNALYHQMDKKRQSASILVGFKRMSNEGR